MKMLAGLIAAILICFFALLYHNQSTAVAHHGPCNHILVTEEEGGPDCILSGGDCCGVVGPIYPE